MMNITVSIRQVEKSDEPVLAAIIRSVFEEYDAPKRGTVYSDPTTDHLFELFEQTRSVLWVARMNDEIVGCCGIYPTEGLPIETAELVKFYLSPLARGKRIGKQLMEKCIRSANELGYTKIYLESLPQFTNAIKLYERMGFTQLEKALGNSGHTSCSIWMILELGTI